MKYQRVKMQHNGKDRRYLLFGERNFIKHSRKHFIKRSDCWSLLLDDQLIKRANAVFKTKSNIELSKSIDKGIVAELYEEVCRITSHEITESASTPRYVWYEKVSGNGNRKLEEVFLSSIGMIMPCKYGTVTTAYVKSSPGETRRTWAIRSYEGLVRKFKNIQSSTADGIHYVTKENWAKPPLPENETTYFGMLVDQALARKNIRRKGK
jgi:hypothetical protein